VESCKLQIPTRKYLSFKPAKTRTHSNRN